MAFVLNLLGLIIVLGLCWIAMMWLSKGFHGVDRPDGLSSELMRDFSVASLPIEDTVSSSEDSAASNVPCQQCEGVGAKQTRGRLQLCPECLGTGVLS